MRRGRAGEARRSGGAAGEDGDAFARAVGPVTVPRSARPIRRAMPSPPCDEGERARRGGGELGLDQREMGAGEHDRVDPLAAGLVEQAVEDRAA